MAKHHVVIAKEIFKKFLPQTKKRSTRDDLEPNAAFPPRTSMVLLLVANIMAFFSSRLCKSFVAAAATDICDWKPTAAARRGGRRRQ